MSFYWTTGWAKQRVPSWSSDLNVLQRSLFARLAVKEAPPCNYEINGHQYDMGYYLTSMISATTLQMVVSTMNVDQMTRDVRQVGGNLVEGSDI